MAKKARRLAGTQLEDFHGGKTLRKSPPFFLERENDPSEPNLQGIMCITVLHVNFQGVIFVMVCLFN